MFPHPVTEVCEDAPRMLGCCGLSARSSSPGPTAPPVACPPHEGATRAVKLSGVEGGRVEARHAPVLCQNSALLKQTINQQLSDWAKGP